MSRAREAAEHDEPCLMRLELLAMQNGALTSARARLWAVTYLMDTPELCRCANRNRGESLDAVIDHMRHVGMVKS